MNDDKCFNKYECSPKENCKNHGKCHECVNFHKEKGSLPMYFRK